MMVKIQEESVYERESNFSIFRRFGYYRYHPVVKGKFQL